MQWATSATLHSGGNSTNPASTTTLQAGTPANHLSNLPLYFQSRKIANGHRKVQASSHDADDTPFTITALFNSSTSNRQTCFTYCTISGRTLVADISCVVVSPFTVLTAVLRRPRGLGHARTAAPLADALTSLSPRTDTRYVLFSSFTL